MPGSNHPRDPREGIGQPPHRPRSPPPVRRRRGEGRRVLAIANTGGHVIPKAGPRCRQRSHRRGRLKALSTRSRPSFRSHNLHAVEQPSHVELRRVDGVYFTNPCPAKLGRVPTTQSARRSISFETRRPGDVDTSRHSSSRRTLLDGSKVLQLRVRGERDREIRLRDNRELVDGRPTSRACVRV